MTNKCNHESYYNLIYEKRKDYPLVWVDAKAGELPLHSVEGGLDCDGETLYVGRALYDKDTIPGKVKLSYGGISVACCASEKNISQYQVLTNPKRATLSWIRYHGTMPDGAIQAGEEGNAVPLYIGRIVSPDKGILVGKVHKERGLMFASFNGGEHVFDIFSVLVVHRRKTVMQRVGTAAGRVFAFVAPVARALLPIVRIFK